MALCKITCNTHLNTSPLFTGEKKMPQTTSVCVFLSGVFIISSSNFILIMKYSFTEICDQKWGSWEISGSMCSGRWQISDDSSVGGHDWFQTLGCIAFNENQWLAVSVLITEDVLTATSCLDRFLFFWVWSLMFVWILSFTISVLVAKILHDPSTQYAACDKFRLLAEIWASSVTYPSFNFNSVSKCIYRGMQMHIERDTWIYLHALI